MLTSCYGKIFQSGVTPFEYYLYGSCFWLKLSLTELLKQLKHMPTFIRVGYIEK